jgi:hypothetical protein
MQVMNHPDLNQEELFALLRSMPADGRADWTAARATEWWNKTHVRGALTFGEISPGELCVTARQSVESLVVEVQLPDGDVELRAIDLVPERPVPLAAGLLVARL